MSDFYRGQSSHSVYGGIIVDVAEDSLDRVTKLLAGVKGGAYKAVGSALQRAAASGKTVAKRAVTEEYAISGSTFLEETKTINHFVRNGSSLEIVFGYRGNVISLTKFNTTVDSNGMVHTSVKKSGSKQALEHAFPAQMGGHSGIYERVGFDRLPVKELYGPATPQMMYSNENVLDKIEEKIVSTYEDRIEHEIDRLLNRWDV